jgi:hypothetical protein
VEKNLSLLAVLMTLSLCLLPGCRRGLGPDADPAAGGKALQDALGAWKDGKSPQDLEGQSPPIIMNEDAWRSGKRLLDFKVEENALVGRQVRSRVRIKLRDEGGKTRDEKAVYIVDTTPRIVIVRDIFATW